MDSVCTKEMWDEIKKEKGREGKEVEKEAHIYYIFILIKGKRRGGGGEREREREEKTVRQTKKNLTCMNCVLRNLIGERKLMLK